jgi:hypothetical protein
MVGLEPLAQHIPEMDETSVSPLAVNRQKLVWGTRNSQARGLYRPSGHRGRAEPAHQEELLQPDSQRREKAQFLYFTLCTSRIRQRLCSLCGPSVISLGWIRSQRLAMVHLCFWVLFPGHSLDPGQFWFILLRNFLLQKLLFIFGHTGNPHCCQGPLLVGQAIEQMRSTDVPCPGNEMISFTISQIVI